MYKKLNEVDIDLFSSKFKEMTNCELILDSKIKVQCDELDLIEIIMSLEKELNYMISDKDIDEIYLSNPNEYFKSLIREKKLNDLFNI